MVDVVGELFKSRDKVNILPESPPDAGDSEEHFQSLELGEKWYLEHFKFDANSTADSQPGVDRFRLLVDGEKKAQQHYAFWYLWLQLGSFRLQKKVFRTTII